MPVDSDDLARLLLNLLKDETKEKQKSALSDLLNPPPSPAEAAQPPKADEPSEKPRPKRCMCPGCKTKITLTDFACKCHGWYCSMHRHAESHSCSFDFKTQGQGILEKQLVKVAGEKLQKV
jgi:hypothetical protein